MSVNSKLDNVKLRNVKSTGVREQQQVKLLELLSGHVQTKHILEIMKIKASAVSRAKNRYIKKGWINPDLTLTEAGIDKIQNVNVTRGLLKNVTEDTVRGHNLVFTLKIPKISSWGKREQYLEKKEISFKKLKNTKTQRILIDKRKIWLNPNSITFYMGKSYFAESADLSMEKALEDLFDLIKEIESRLHIRFRFANGYKIRVSRQHYALVKNALAKKFNEEGQKLFVNDENGVWLIIDNSHQFNELETVNAKTSQEDNQPIKDFFNDLKKNPLTLTEARKEYMQGFKMMADNYKSHVGLVKEIKELIKIFKEIKK